MSRRRRGADWTFVVNPSRVDLSVPRAALDAAPPAVAAAQDRLLPRRSGDRLQCRICGRTARLTREHIPPATAGNQGEHYVQDVDVVLDADQLIDDFELDRSRLGGVWGRTLCQRCNNRTGAYATEYRRWATSGAHMLQRCAKDPNELDALAELRLLEVEFRDAAPGAFARQVLSNMCSLSAAWNLADAHPELRGMVLDGAPGVLPPGMSLSMAFYYSSTARYVGPTLQFRDNGEWRWLLELAFFPFVFTMTIAADWSEVDPLCGIDNFLEVGPSAHGTVELALPVTFGHVPWPADYRSRGQLEAGFDIFGRPGPSHPT